MDGLIIAYENGDKDTVHTAPIVLGDIGVVTRRNGRGKVEYTLSSVGYSRNVDYLIDLIEIPQMCITLNDGRVIEANPYTVIVTESYGTIRFQDQKEISRTIEEARGYIKGLGGIVGHIVPISEAKQNGNGVLKTYLPQGIKLNGDRKVKVTDLLEEMLSYHEGAAPKLDSLH